MIALALTSLDVFDFVEYLSNLSITTASGPREPESLPMTFFNYTIRMHSIKIRAKNDSRGWRSCRWF